MVQFEGNSKLKLYLVNYCYTCTCTFIGLETRLVHTPDHQYMHTVLYVCVCVGGGGGYYLYLYMYKECTNLSTIALPVSTVPIYIHVRYALLFIPADTAVEPLLRAREWYSLKALPNSNSI